MKNKIQKLKNQIIMKLGGVTRVHYERTIGEEWARQVNLEFQIDELKAQKEVLQVELET